MNRLYSKGALKKQGLTSSLASTPCPFSFDLNLIMCIQLNLQSWSLNFLHKIVHGQSLNVYGSVEVQENEEKPKGQFKTATTESVISDSIYALYVKTVSFPGSLFSCHTCMSYTASMTQLRQLIVHISLLFCVFAVLSLFLPTSVLITQREPGNEAMQCT